MIAQIVEVVVKKPNVTAANQLRFSMPWHGDAMRCRGCRYLAEIGKGVWQCIGARDAYDVVSDGAICVVKRSDRREDSLYGDMNLQEQDKLTEGEDLCSRCGAVLPARGCSCRRCGYKDC